MFSSTDIGANLLDPMYSGEYNGKAYHKCDLPAVLRRSYAAGVERIIITAGNLSEARAALDLARTDGTPAAPIHLHCKLLQVKRWSLQSVDIAEEQRDPSHVQHV